MSADNTAIERARQLFRDGRYAEAESTLSTAFRNGLVPGASAFWLLADIEGVCICSRASHGARTPCAGELALSFPVR